jgi:ADP-ribose pyrophosphatase
MPEKVVLHGKKRVYDGFFKLDEAKVSYEQFDGRMSPVVTRLSLERGDAVAALVFDTDTRELILVRQFRFPTWEKGPGWVCELVAGMIDGAELPETAIRREILEETGYSVSKLEKIAAFYLSPGGSSERVFLFYAEVNHAGRAADGTGAAQEHEDIQTVRMTLAEAQQEMDSGHLPDAKTLVGIMWLLSRR